MRRVSGVAIFLVGSLFAAFMAGLNQGAQKADLLIAEVNRQHEVLVDRLNADWSFRESELLAANQILNERSVEVGEEVVRYVYETIVPDGCAIDDGGMQQISDYIKITF